MQYGLTLTEKLWDSASMPPIESDSWEIGRLVIAPEFRNGQDTLKHCLLMGLTKLREHADAGNLHACCASPVLSRLYRRFGYSVVGRDVADPATGKTYALIHGVASTVLATLRGTDAGPALPSHRLH